ncbi:MAG: hypothetical protein ACOY3Z_04710 [Thermodesulfobacteriota bacterium]
MGKKKKIAICVVFSILVATPSYADVVWPALYVVSRMVVWWVIVLGVLIEYLFVRKLTGFSIAKSTLADLAMNGISSLFGVFCLPLAGLGWEFFPGSIVNALFDLGTFNLVTWTATFFIAVIVNAWLENTVIRYLFKKNLGQRGFWWFSLANAISVGLVFLGIYILPPEL